MKVEGKAELIGGRVVKNMASGELPSEVAFEIAVSLREHIRTNKLDGKAYADGVGYAIDPPLTSTRESFQPDASYYSGMMPVNRMRFIEGPPTFAVEVRSENDYGRTADREYAGKRDDYFEAGTMVVWDVDPLAKTITKYVRSALTQGTRFPIGEQADAEPAVPGWKLDLETLFGQD